jgi:hypothetical protein
MSLVKDASGGAESTRITFGTAVRAATTVPTICFGFALSVMTTSTLAAPAVT